MASIVLSVWYLGSIPPVHSSKASWITDISKEHEVSKSHISAMEAHLLCRKEADVANSVNKDMVLLRKRSV